MKEFNYLVEKARMVRSFTPSGKGCGDVDCSKCPLSAQNNGAELKTSCRDFELNYPREATETVRGWAIGHPRKSLVDELIEKFPNTLIQYDTSKGLRFPYMICAKRLGLVYECPQDDTTHCVDCWNQEVEE